MSIKKFFQVFLLLFVFGCSNVSFISGQKSDDLYTKTFLANIESIKKQYAAGDKKGSLEKLKKIKEDSLLPTEKSLRRNLIGVIQFSSGEYEQAIFNFDIALSTSGLDDSLTSQIYMNLAGSYYKLQSMDKAYSSLKLIREEQLAKSDKGKFYELKLMVSRELGHNRDALLTLIHLVGSAKSLELVKGSDKFNELVNVFFKLESGERLRVLEEFDDSKTVVVGYLGYLEAEKRYYLGQKDEAKQILEWVSDKFGEDKDIASLVSGFASRIVNFTKMDQKSIGVILPMTGSKKEFGERALVGIDSGFREKLMKGGYTLHLSDSKGSGVVGALRVKELVETKYVSVIIGGLFSSTAEKEYLEAKKYGVLFISLAPVYLPKSMKDTLLIEVPGSIESQINTLLSSKVLSHLGNKAAILYSDDSTGEAYVSEFWRVASEKGLEITGAIPYSPTQNDFRDQVQNILGLKFKRDRQEELELVSEINNLKEKGSVRRLLDLKPTVDFNWVFVQSTPNVALQLLPSFRYFDAPDLTFVGGPTWRSKSLAKDSKKIGKLYFVGEDVDKAQESISSSFQAKYNSKAKIIEIYSYDATKMIEGFLLDQSYNKREELDGSIKKKAEITGITGNWKQSDGIWIKDMSLLQMKKETISHFL